MRFSARERWAPHATFGLRPEWVELFASDPVRWPKAGLLGPRQVHALRAWIVTCGLALPDGRPSAVSELIVGTKSRLAGWQLAWGNAVFTFAPAAFWVQSASGVVVTTTQLRSALKAAYPDRSIATLGDGVSELVGLLERTPIGAELGQGLVSPTRPRTVRRVGLADPHPAALAHAMRRLFQRERCPQLPLHRDLLWPWVVFGCDPQETLLRLTAAGHGWLAIDSDRARLLIPWEELYELALF